MCNTTPKELHYISCKKSAKNITSNTTPKEDGHPQCQAIEIVKQTRAAGKYLRESAEL